MVAKGDECTEGEKGNDDTKQSILTEEQRERIRLNKERALERQKIRKLEVEQTLEDGTKRRKVTTPSKMNSGGTVPYGDDESSVDLEEFEMDASPWVSKKEAMKMYCLPEGTLAVCAYEERPNPQHKGWTPMKLYSRTEIRRRARERFGGLQGLVEERRRREEKKFQKDFEKGQKMFS
ncbi:hypothetical protein MPSEU_001034500 [Mayamaea pseudoterrestris]|nr:hypothetical protein MPSEU_001034500 [Mayamaea pseudoterrestris]